MRKKSIVISIVFILTLFISTCGCSPFTDTIKSATYNTGKLQSGYTKVKSIQGIEFAVPSIYKENALSEMEYIEKNLKVQTGEEDASVLFENTFELKSGTSYNLINKSKFMLTIGKVKLSQDVSNIKNSDDLNKEIKNIENSEITTKLNNKILTSSINGEDKVICSISSELISSDYDSKISYKGYISIIENKNNETFLMIVASADENAEEISKYIAKSLEFNGEDIVNIKDDNTTNTPEETTPSPTISTPTPTTTDPKPVTQDSKLKDFKLSINGTTIKLPINTKKLLDTLNLKLSLEDAKTTLKKDTYIFTTIQNPNDNTGYFTVAIINATDKDNLPLEECQIFSISADKYEVYGYGENITPNFSVVLPSNIMISKSTYEEVLKVYGKPTETQNNESSKFIYLTWDLSKRDYDYQTKMEIIIDKETNLVYEFTYAKLPY